MDMGDYRKYLDKQMEDEGFRKEWQESEAEYRLMRLFAASGKESLYDSVRTLESKEDK